MYKLLVLTSLTSLTHSRCGENNASPSGENTHSYAILLFTEFFPSPHVIRVLQITLGVDKSRVNHYSPFKVEKKGLGK